MTSTTGSTTSPSARTAVVTGGARGIGAEVARRLAGDGYQLAVLDLDAERCAATVEDVVGAGGTAAAFGVDVSDERSVERAVAEVAEALGPPVVVVNNAGITRDNLLFKMSVSDWDSVIAVHLRGSFLMSRATQDYMRMAGFGRIVNLSSMSALGNRGQANYAAAKAGLQGLTKTLAIELGRYGVTVNAVAPGFVATDMTAATAERIGVTFEEFKKQTAAQIPVGRVGEPHDVADAVAFFASPRSGYVSGQVLYVAGGPVD